MEAEAKQHAATLELQQRERQLQDITNERDTLLAERTALETQHQFAEQRASGLEQQLQAAIQRIHETEQHLAQAMQYIASLEGDLRIARDERNDVMKQKERLLEQLKKCQSRVVASHRSSVPKDGDETLPDWLKRGV
jgi:chromosome segregation ATPase